MGDVMVNNIWREKKIAPLEYCSLERAAKLLNCELEDLIHWNKIGAIMMAIEPKGLTGDLFVYFNKWHSVDIERYKDKFNIESELGFSGSIFKPILRCKADICFRSLPHGFAYLGRIHGLWVITIGVIDKVDNTLVVSKLQNGYKTFQPVKKSDNIHSVFFFYKGEKELLFELKDLFITRSDIEKIWDSVISGNPMESYFTGKIREDKSIQISQLSLAQTARHEQNRQRVEEVAKQVRANHLEECSKGGKLTITNWVKATMKNKDRYGGFVITSDRTIATILSEILKDERASNTTQ
ncbi:MAG TPA: hypothetical protein VJY31_18405 [Buttiauxella sp.]|nr:hypothetical protein [Buttiauxella sp.]